MDLNLTLKEFPMFSEPLDNFELKTIGALRNQSRDDEKEMVRKKVKGLLSLLSTVEDNHSVVSQDNGTGKTCFSIAIFYSFFYLLNNSFTSVYCETKYF